MKGKVGRGDGRLSLMHLPNPSRHFNRAQGSSFAFLMHSPNFSLHSLCERKHLSITIMIILIVFTKLVSMQVALPYNSGPL